MATVTDAAGREQVVVSAELLGEPCAEPGCGRTVHVGIPYCPRHLQQRCKLRIQPSTIPGAGLGVFAWDPAAPAGAVVIRKGETVGRASAAAAPDICTRPYEKHGVAAEYALRVGSRTADFATYRVVAVMANTASVGGRTNARLAVSSARGGTVAIRAMRPLRHGDEVLVDYGSCWRKTAARPRGRVVYMDAVP